MGLVGLGSPVTVLTNPSIGAAGPLSVDGVGVRAWGEQPCTHAARVARAAELRALVREERPDYVLMGDPAAHQVARLGDPPGAPYAPVFYGTELHTMRRTLEYGGLSPSRLLARRLTRRYLDRADGAICISRYTAGLLERLGVQGLPTAIVYPCVSDAVLSHPARSDAAVTLRGRFGWPDDGVPILLTVARISERKNQLGVLRALAHLGATSGVRYRYAIVGNVDSEQHRGYRRELEDFVAAEGLAGSIGSIEQATDAEKTDYLDGCDVFAMLSQTVGESAEGFGISVIEASCRGKPVVVSDQGGMPETILEGRTGFAVPPDQPAAAANALGLLADFETRVRLGDAGRAFARAEFTPRGSARSLLDFVAGRPAVGRSGH